MIRTYLVRGYLVRRYRGHGSEAISHDQRVMGHGSWVMSMGHGTTFDLGARPDDMVAWL